MDNKTTIHELKEAVRKYCEARDWDQFHGAKDMAVALSIEASELLEHFRFKNKEEVEEHFKHSAMRSAKRSLMCFSSS